MKKVLLIGFLVFCIFQMMVMAAVITVGHGAIDRSSGWSGQTFVCKTDTATGTGTITSIEIWSQENITNPQIATFFVVSGDNLSTRDSVTLGECVAGAKRTFTVDSGGNPISIDVEAGDCIGIYTAQNIEQDTAGGGCWYKAGDNIPCTNVGYTSHATLEVSLYATGATTAEDNVIFFGTDF